MEATKTIKAIYDILPKDAADWACSWLLDGLIYDVENGITDDNIAAANIYTTMQYIWPEDLKQAHEDCCLDMYEDKAFIGAIGFVL